MLLGVNAGDPPADQRPDQQFQTPAEQENEARLENQKEQIRREILLAVRFRVFTPCEIFQLRDGERPQTIGSDEFNERRLRRNEFNATAELPFGFGMM